MGFVDDLKALEGAGKSLEAMVQAQAERLKEGIILNPGPILKELRTWHPNLMTPGFLVITRYDDVVQALDDEDTFSVAPYAEATTRDNEGPNFALGMERSPEYVHDISILRLAVRWEDVPAISTWAEGTAQTLLAEAGAGGSLDIANGYGRLLAARFCGDYFGTPGPDMPTLMHWTRDIFHDIFFNFTHDPQISAAGLASSRAFNAYLAEQVGAAHEAGTPAAPSPFGGTVLGRLVAMQGAPPAAFTDAQVVTGLSGCAVGVVDNVMMGIVNALDVLLARPDALAGAAVAAQAGDDALLQRYVREALRFNPPAKLVLRSCLRDFVLAAGTMRETHVPAGKLVFPATSSAMMDEGVLDRPDEFRLDRPEHHYLLFGWGLHQCLGKYIAPALIAGALKPLLRRPGLRRAPGSGGTVQYADSFPSRFVVEFDADAGAA
jgi:cytochrome P450